jgi:hypothetical protein
MLRKSRPRAIITWNYPIGTDVIVTLDDGTERQTKTRSRTSVVGGVQVIWLEGISGCYMLSRVRPLTKEPSC